MNNNTGITTSQHPTYIINQTIIEILFETYCSRNICIYNYNAILQHLYDSLNSLAGLIDSITNNPTYFHFRKYQSHINNYGKLDILSMLSYEHNVNCEVPNAFNKVRDVLGAREYTNSNLRFALSKAIYESFYDKNKLLEPCISLHTNVKTITYDYELHTSSSNCEYVINMNFIEDVLCKISDDFHKRKLFFDHMVIFNLLYPHIQRIVHFMPSPKEIMMFNNPLDVITNVRAQPTVNTSIERCKHIVRYLEIRVTSNTTFMNAVYQLCCEQVKIE